MHVMANRLIDLVLKMCDAPTASPAQLGEFEEYLTLDLGTNRAAWKALREVLRLRQMDLNVFTDQYVRARRLYAFMTRSGRSQVTPALPSQKPSGN